MNDRDRLIELFKNMDKDFGITCPNWNTDKSCDGCKYRIDSFECNYLERKVDYLLANGVTVQECGHWVSYQSDEPYGCEDEKEWHKCSKCGNDAYGRCYEDEWYSAPILSAYCPHCGAKMMLQPPKGE